MNLKQLYITTGIFIAAALITLFLTSRPPAVSSDARIGMEILDSATLEDLASIELYSEGTQLEFARTSSNWISKTHHDLPIQISRLRELIGSITSEKALRLVSKNADRIQAMGFESPDRVVFKKDDGTVISDISFGKTTERRRQVIRFGTEDKAYTIANPVNFDIDGITWLKKDLLKLDAKDIAEIQATLPNGEKAHFAQSDGEWSLLNTPEGKQLIDSKKTVFSGKLSNLSFTDLKFLDDESVVAAMGHTYTLQVKTTEGTNYTVTLAQSPEEEKKELEDGEQAPPELPRPAMVHITSDKENDPLNGYMAATAFQISPYTLNGLPKSLDELLEDKPIEIVDPKTLTMPNEILPKDPIPESEKGKVGLREFERLQNEKK